MKTCQSAVGLMETVERHIWCFAKNSSESIFSLFLSKYYNPLEVIKKCHQTISTPYHTLLKAHQKYKKENCPNFAINPLANLYIDNISQNTNKKSRYHTNLIEFLLLAQLFDHPCIIVSLSRVVHIWYIYILASML